MGVLYRYNAIEISHIMTDGEEAYERLRHWCAGRNAVGHSRGHFRRIILNHLPRVPFHTDESRHFRGVPPRLGESHTRYLREIEYRWNHRY